MSLCLSAVSFIEYNTSSAVFYYYLLWLQIYQINSAMFSMAYPARAGLTMVPNVPWHRAPPAIRGPPHHKKKFF